MLISVPRIFERIRAGTDAVTGQGIPLAGLDIPDHRVLGKLGSGGIREIEFIGQAFQLIRGGVEYVELRALDLDPFAPTGVTEAELRFAEVFLLYGQMGYRRIERRCLERIIRAHEQMVMTVGGGIVSEAETFNLLLMNCYTVWVKASPEEHMSRVVAQGDLRPMEGSAEAMEDMRRILVARESLYSKADYTLDTTGRTPQECLAQLRIAVTPNH